MAERTSGKASGGQLEERIDLTAEAATKTQQATTLAQAGQLPEALALLAALEKKCRLGNDNPSLVKACETSLTLAKEYGDHASILQVLQTLSTRRSQKTAAIRALVQTALPWCVEEPYKPLDVEPALKPQRDELVGVLLEITEGKIFLERERAQLTRAMATIKVGYDYQMMNRTNTQRNEQSVDKLKCRRFFWRFGMSWLMDDCATH